MEIVIQIFIIFSLIVVGYIIRRIGIVSEAMNKELSRFVMNVTLPAFLLTSMDFEFSPEILKASGLLILISFSVYAFSILLSKVYSKVMGNTGGTKSVIEYVIVFSNTGYMGYPVVRQIFGQKGVFYAAIYNLAFTILIWTYGVKLLKGSNNDEKLSFKETMMHLLNPGLVAIAIGYTMFLLNLSFPAPIKGLLQSVGSMTTPLSMMFIGFILTEVKLKSAFFNTQLWFTSIIRLIIIPAITFLVLSSLGISGLTLYIPVIITAMPAAVNTAVFAAEYNADYKLGSLLIFGSTLLSAITIPILLLLIK